MKIVTSTIFVYGIMTVSSASIRSQIPPSIINENKADDFTDNSSQNDSIQFLPSSEIWGSQREVVSPESTTIISLSNPLNDTKWDKGLPANLIQKITTILQKRQSSLNNQYDPNKQLFGGRLPPFIERIIQRIQNYFSVYNPPEYFENNRPPQAQNEGLTIICSNSVNDSLSCNEANEEENPDEQENPEICDFNPSESTDPCDIDPNSIKCAHTNLQTAQDEYNVVVTHTVMQDSSLNVYSPADATHTVSNVVLILEPSRAEYSPPVENATNRNKFYVYVNPTAASANTTTTTTDEKDEQKTWNRNATGNQGNVQPYVNTRYTVIIRSDKLEEYSSNVDNADNVSLNPDIAIFTKNSVANASRLTLCKPVESALNINCGRQTKNDSNPLSVELSGSVASRSISSTAGVQRKNDNKVPDIDLALVPPDYNKSKNKNKSNCSSSINKATSSPPSLEFYVLKPNLLNNTTAKDKEKQTFRLHKTFIEGVASPTYLPPKQLQVDVEDQSANNIDIATTGHQNVTKSTLLFDLLKTYPEKSTALPVSLKEIESK